MFPSTPANHLYFQFCPGHLSTALSLISFSVLGVDRDNVNKAEVGKIYRKLAGKWHPDRHKKPEDKEKAEKKFMQIAAA